MFQHLYHYRDNKNFIQKIMLETIRRKLCWYCNYYNVNNVKMKPPNYSEIYRRIWRSRNYICFISLATYKMNTKLTKIELKNDSWGSSLTEIEKQMLSLSSVEYTINRIDARYISLDADVKQVNTWIKCNGSR